MSKPPAYVSHVEMNAIVVASLDRATARRLQEAGLDISRSWFGDGRLAIAPPTGTAGSSADEEDKLMQLARLGIAFASDYKQGMDPQETELSQTPSRLFLGSLTLTLGNPKTLVFFVALLPTVVHLETLTLTGFLEIAAVSAIVLPSILAAYVLVEVRARRLLQSPRALRLVNRGSATVIAGAAVAVARA